MTAASTRRSARPTSRRRRPRCSTRAHRRHQRRHRARLRTIVRHPGAAEFTVQLTDEIPRLRDPRRAADRFARLVAAADLSAFSFIDRSTLRAGSVFAPLLPRLVMPLVERRLRAESSDVVLPADDAGLSRFLAKRRRAGMRPNVNVLGEAIVGNDEASARLDAVLGRLRRPDVDYVSVKISAICAGISTLAFEHTVDRIADRLRVIYGAAAACNPLVFVNLDMEEYRDLDLTVAAFRRVLGESPFLSLDAGIVLQAYLPDAYAVAGDLGEWAVDRRRRGGGRIKVRLVKGANLAMETVEAELRGWEPAPFGSKGDVDANYKAILDLLGDPSFDDAVDIGVGSHNLFDVAWALAIRDKMIAAGRRDRLGIEMLAGMAPSPVRGRTRRRRRARPLRTDRATRRLPIRTGVPGPPTRREHRAGELPVAAVRSRGRPDAVRPSSGSVPSRGRATPPARPSSASAAGSPHPAEASGRGPASSTPPTPIGPVRRTAPGSPTPWRRRLRHLLWPKSPPTTSTVR